MSPPARPPPSTCRTSRGSSSSRSRSRPGSPLRARAGRCASTPPAATCTPPRPTWCCPKSTAARPGSTTTTPCTTRSSTAPPRPNPCAAASTGTASWLGSPASSGARPGVRRAGLPLLPARRRPRAGRPAVRGRALRLAPHAADGALRRRGGGRPGAGPDRLPDGGRGTPGPALPGARREPRRPVARPAPGPRRRLRRAALCGAPEPPQPRARRLGGHRPGRPGRAQAPDSGYGSPAHRPDCVAIPRPIRLDRRAGHPAATQRGGLRARTRHPARPFPGHAGPHAAARRRRAVRRRPGAAGRAPGDLRARGGGPGPRPLFPRAQRAGRGGAAGVDAAGFRLGTGRTRLPALRPARGTSAARPPC